VKIKTRVIDSMLVANFRGNKFKTSYKTDDRYLGSVPSPLCVCVCVCETRKRYVVKHNLITEVYLMTM